METDFLFQLMLAILANVLATIIMDYNSEL